MNDVMYSIKEIAECLDTNENVIKTLIIKYDFPVHKTNGELLFNKNEVDKYVYDNQIYGFIENQKETTVLTYSDY